VLPKKFTLLVSSCALLSAMPAYGFNTISPQADTKGAYTLINSNVEESAAAFIANLEKRGVGFLKDSSLSDEQRTEAFSDLLKDNFDMKTIGRFALGRYWKTTSPEQRKEYLQLFENMVIAVYSRRFSDYNGQALEIISTREKGKSDAIVSSYIVPESGPKIKIDWRVREGKNKKIKVIDVIVEGVSMSLTQRSDFASVIQRGGGKIDVLLDHLKTQ